MGKRGRPAGKKASQAPKAAASQPSKYGIARFLVRSTPAARPGGEARASPATAVPMQASQPKLDQDDGPPAQRLGDDEEAAGRYSDARPVNPSPRPAMGSVRQLELPVLVLPVVEPAPALASPMPPHTEERSPQPAKRPRISGGLGFLLSQNDGDEVVWHASPLPVRPALPALEDGPGPRDGSGYARGGPAGFSGRSSPVPAVKSMLSTASMLKQCGKTTSPPDTKPMSSILEQWLQPRASPAVGPAPGVLTPQDANRQKALISSPEYTVAAAALGASVSERALVLVDAAPSAAISPGSREPREDSTKETPPTGRLSLAIQSPAEQLWGEAASDAAPGLATPRFTAPGQPGKKVLLELLDRVESAVRQRRQSGSPQDALHSRSPLISRRRPSLALPGDSDAIQRLAASLEAISERTEGEGESPATLECQEKGLAVVPEGCLHPGEKDGAPGGDAGPLALGVSAAELAALQAAFGLDEEEWQDEALLQEVRAACLAAEGHAPQPQAPQTGQPQQATATPLEKDGAGQSLARDMEAHTNEERAAAEAQVAGTPEGAEKVAAKGGVAAEGWEGQPRGEGDAAEAGGLDTALLQHQFVVTEVADCAGTESGLENVPQKVLRVVGDLHGDEARLLLQDEWADTPVAAGDRMSVLGEWAVDPATRDRQCVLSRRGGLLVHHPDVLVKGSKVGSASACLRRVVLEERLHGDDMSQAALLGTLLHMLFQAALLSGDVSSESLEEEAWLLVQQAQEKLYAAGESEQSALEHLCGSIPAIQHWAHDFLRPAHAQVPETMVDFGVEGQLATAVTQVVDIEESVWSPLYGLKGKIDASLRVATRGRGPPRTTVMPFELKTGKSTTGFALLDHRAQVIMYTLLMGDRYQEAIPGGLLFHSHTGRSLGIPVQRSELVSLLQRRNQLAHALAAAARSHPAGPALPAVLQEDRQCQKCSQLEACAVYQAATHEANPAQGGSWDCSENEAVAGKGSHLSAGHAAFFRHWEYLLSKEEEETQGDLRGVWGASGQQQQAAGQCLAALRLAGEPERLAGGTATAGGRAHTLVYHFRPCGYAAQDGPLHEGDYVLLSTEGDHAAVAIATGVIVSKDPDGIKVSVPAALRLPARGGLSGAERLASTTWRLDRNETAYHSNLARSNLVALLAASGDDRRRALIVDKQAPVFDGSLLGSQDPALAYCRQLHHINDDQRAALTQVLCARDYCMVLGMPGTGKTTTICHAVRALLARGASVLVTSHTNSAVDNILTKLHQQGVEFVRVGRLASIHPAVQHAALDNPGTAPASVAALEARVAAARVVGVTCLGVTHPLFRKRTFDVCIVDEASQITLPAVLGPLLCARAFVLVGDHHQLPPLVKSAAAREGGLDVSLFKLLSDAHPEAVAALQTQYRMCADIMLLSNTLVYDHRLRCASPALASARLAVTPDFAGSQDSAWLRAAVDPLRRVVFLDTDSLGGGGQEARQQGAVHNMAEACLVTKVVSALEAGGVSPADIGVISPYQAQVKLIARLTPDLRAAGLEVHTVDKYQGRDKECILVSFVRSNREKAAGQLLQDARRINVALTRAKKKLVLVGSGSTLGGVPLLAGLLRLVLDQRWLVCLPPRVLQHQPLHVPRDDAAALRLAAHVQQSLSQREVDGTPEPDAAQNGHESSEGVGESTPARPARYSPKGKIWKVFQKGTKSKDMAGGRRPLKPISDNVVANRKLA